MISNMMRNLNNTMLRLDKRQMQGYTGKRIHKASDDPIATSRVLKTKADISQLRQYNKNVDDSISWLENTETAVKNVNEALQRVRELSVQAANGVLTEEETKQVNEEIKQLKSQIISLGNTTYGSSYIFSGKKIDKPLLDENGYYNIDLKDYLNPYMVDDKKDVQVGSRENIGVNTLGFEIFEGYEKPIVYSDKINGGKVTLTLPNGETIDTGETDIDEAMNKLKEMSEEYDSPLKGYRFEEVTSNEWDGTTVDKDVVRIKATPTDALAVDKKSSPAVWETGAITAPDLDAGKTATFTFMGVDLNIVQGDASVTTTTTENITGKGATIIVADNKKLTADHIKNALEKISAESNSKIAGFKFAEHYTTEPADPMKKGLRIIAPESAGGRYNKEVYTATLEEDGTLNVNLVVEGADESKSVTKGQQAGIIQLLDKLEKEMIAGNHEEINNLLDNIDIFHQSLLTTKSEIGAKVNRMDLVKERIAGDIINFRDLQSQLEDADMAEVIMELMNEENVYRSALSIGARIIQPSLLDFLR